ncbi:Reverse transcriptase zinc-binding domain [Arabidopsis suecica]|uniref:Reverse transcriptase zinc-binding domain n=1 Tax=Arabidopsis suecica TaxID=45249 RepID=A0A8T1XWH7_ARASU|nr:Reverse transcriptase zinc-binding domain [Arabidopsis suecica]
MLQLKTMLATFMRCNLGNGQLASFWFDSWMDCGPLISLLGDDGPRQLRIRRDARVVDATRNGQWNMPNARSELIQNFLISLTAITPPCGDRGNDQFLWRNAAGVSSRIFSAKATWEQLCDHSPLVPWSNVVWFKEAVPRFAFSSWLALRGRLPTRDRLRRWGMTVPSSCVLCNSANETHDHLFFECSFSSAIWSFFASKLISNPPTSLGAVASWLHARPVHASQPRPPDSTITKLIFQASISAIWRERNSRIFSTVSCSIQDIRKVVDRFLRDRLLSFPAPDSSSLSLLAFYFGCIPFV